MSETEGAGFQEIEHTADKAIEVWAPTLEALFEQAALGMFSLMADLETVSAASRHDLTLPFDDVEVALIDWLSELLYYRDTYSELYGEFGVTIDGKALGAWFAGGPGEPAGPAVKAATYHNLAVERDASGLWRATVVFDT